MLGLVQEALEVRVSEMLDVLRPRVPPPLLLGVFGLRDGGLADIGIIGVGEEGDEVGAGAAAVVITDGSLVEVPVF